MRNRTGFFGFPSQKEQDSVQFYFFKSIPYTTRMAMYLMLIFVGFVFQFLTFTAFSGVVFLVCATLLNLMKGYNVRINIRNFKLADEWTTVDMERINEIEKLDNNISKWKSDFFDITNGKGILGFILTGFVIVVLSVNLEKFFGNSQIAKIILVDSAILLLPLWFNGTKQAFRQSELKQKIGIVKQMEKCFQSAKKEGESFKPALKLARGQYGKAVPIDARFTVFFDGMPSDFYGLQAQISMNKVQTAQYPYFYCVIPAKPGYGLKNYINKIAKNINIIVEFQMDLQAEVIVIRQNPDKVPAGYHTKTDGCINIFMTALGIARKILSETK